MNVLVAIPYRSDTPRMFLDGMCGLFARLTWPRRALALLPNDAGTASGSPSYGGHARARNTLVSTCLCAQHTHVLWLDVDLVRAPADLIERLSAVSTGDVVAPFVFVEKLDPGRGVSRDNGGWFYDTGAFVRGAEHAAHQPPYFAGYAGGVIELDSVGCCYLIPADLYRRGCRYEPQGDEVEHLSLMRQVRQLSRRVLATGEVEVSHAYLPRYGERWHA